VLVGVLANEHGPHGDGFTTGPSGFGGRKWFFRCGGCGGRAVYLYRPLGAESFTCRRCWGLAYPKSRITLGIGKVYQLEEYVRSFDGRPGRKPRRWHRAVKELRMLLRLGYQMLAPE
jgi:hypothetical protein